jgi:hypothetical protein
MACFAHKSSISQLFIDIGHIFRRSDSECECDSLVCRSGSMSGQFTDIEILSHY